MASLGIEAASAPRDPGEAIRREARVSGLHEMKTPSLELVERRRLQVWALGVGTMVVLTGFFVAYLLWPNDVPLPGWVSPLWVRPGLAGLALALTAYVVEKEVHLQRLTKLLVEERVLTAALTNRVRELSTLIRAGRAVNSVLGLSDALRVILSSALELLEGRSGSVMLVEAEELVVACASGNERANGARVQIGHGISGRVAQTREPMLISGVPVPGYFSHVVDRDEPVDSSMSVPLIHRGQLLGVLNVNAAADRRFSEYDLRATALFGDHAAVAIANARLYEEQRTRVAELVEGGRAQARFAAAIGRELRGPLSAIAATAEAGLADPAAGAGSFEAVRVEALRLVGLVERFVTGRDPSEGSGERVPVDVALLARSLGADLALADLQVSVGVEGEAEVLCDAAVLRRVVLDLVDAVVVCGRPPVRITVTRDGDRAAIGVGGRGVIVPPEDRWDAMAPSGVGGDGRGRLGLGPVRAAIAIQGGALRIEDDDADADGGTSFVVSLPILDTGRPEAIPA